MELRKWKKRIYQWPYLYCKWFYDSIFTENYIRFVTNTAVIEECWTWIVWGQNRWISEITLWCRGRWFLADVRVQRHIVFQPWNAIAGIRHGTFQSVKRFCLRTYDMRTLSLTITMTRVSLSPNLKPIVVSKPWSESIISWPVFISRKQLSL